MINFEIFFLFCICCRFGIKVLFCLFFFFFNTVLHWKDHYFCIELFLQFCQKSTDCVYLGVWRALCFVFTPAPYCSINVTLKLVLKSRKVLQHYFFPQLVSTILGPFHFHMNFSFHLSISTGKAYWNFDWDSIGL